MPRVEITRSRGGVPTTTGQPRATTGGAAISQSLGRELESAGRQLTGIGLEISDKIKKTRDADYLSNAIVDANEQIIRFEKEFRKNSVDNPTGHANAYIEQVDSIYSDFVNGAPSNESRRQLQQIFSSQRTGRFKSAVNFF